jgi:hypothetical protein
MLTDVEITAFAQKMRRVLTGADEFPDNWARLRRRSTAQPRKQRPCGAELRRAYEEATGTEIGCD